MTERFLIEREVAELTRLSVRTLQGLRHRGGGPRWVKLGARAVRYRLEDVQAWVDEGARRTTGDCTGRAK